MSVVVPAVVLMGRFRRFYPGEWRSPLYPTRDSIIPADEFWMLYRAMPSVSAKERIDTMLAVLGAIASAFGAKGERPASVTADLREAFIAEG